MISYIVNIYIYIYIRQSTILESEQWIKAIKHIETNQHTHTHTDLISHLLYVYIYICTYMYIYIYIYISTILESETLALKLCALNSRELKFTKRRTISNIRWLLCCSWPRHPRNTSHARWGWNFWVPWTTKRFHPGCACLVRISINTCSQLAEQHRNPA